MIVSLIKGKKLLSTTLPEKVQGKYWITENEHDDIRNLLSIEANHDQWLVRSTKDYSVIDNQGNAVDTVLLPLSFYNVKFKNFSERSVLFSEPNTTDRYTYKKLVVKDPCSFTIGRTDSNNIVYANKFVSSTHCVLDYDGTNWSIVDKGSRNGTFVNNYRVDSQNLKPGDFVFILGLRIVIGSNYIAMNNPDGLVKINTTAFTEFKMQQYAPRDVKASEQEDFFYRSPRLLRHIETKTITIDPPPQLQKGDDTPMALVLGPALTMGIAAASMAVMTVINISSGRAQLLTSFPSILMAFSMLLGTVLWPILTRNFDKKKRLRLQTVRQQKYLAYLDSIRDIIMRTCQEQSEILHETIISVDECLDRIIMVKRTLWEREITQEDFLTLRLGLGELPLDVEIRYPEKKFSLDDDSLQDAMLALAGEKKVLSNVPISISLTHDFVAGVIGEAYGRYELVKSLVIQAAALHSYDELKIVLIARESQYREWQFLENVPHFWNDEKTVRYIGTDLDEVKEISLILNREIEEQVKENKEYSEYSPYYLIVSLDKDLTDKCEAINKLVEYKVNSGFSLICVREELKDLPKETTSVITVDGNRCKVFDKNDISGKMTTFFPEYGEAGKMAEAAAILSNINLDLSSNRYSLPKMITFLEMYQVGKIDYLNILSRWSENNPVNSLQAQVGVDTQGEPFLLDLHEKYHGPHGLVAGMTGSGKSEFIITYILSLAINYHPNEVAFILIDYKGGGLAGAFEDEERGIKLPHLAGTITNLDGNAIKRSLVSIQSELRRRQAIFNEARKIANEGTIDIYTYQNLYRNGIVSEPIPHLFIISDEFAELKAQQPEFMEQLISAARIGRSLGVHLILATQKPSGVVDDQIWSNSKFRVCLKVQEKADSQDMIKRPDAAAIKETGRFYLQVGFNEFFAMGQSAWSGADYVPSESLEKKVDASVEVIDHLGRVVYQAKPKKQAADIKSKSKQIVSIVKYLSDLAQQENIYERPLWLEPIPEKIYVEKLKQKYAYTAERLVLNPIIGEYDDPFNQKQNLLTLPLSQEGNCLVYGSTGSGKAMLLSALIYSLISTHSVADLNLYIMDFDAETLRAFEKAPQVGGVVLSADEEKVVNLFKMLRQELEMRKQLFSDYGGNYMAYCKATGKVLPNILVLLNNYVAFNEQYDYLEESFGNITREGVKYGITFVVTLPNINSMRYRYLQNFKQGLTLQQNDVSDYPMIVGRTDGLVPSKFIGRGLILLDRLFEFQTALAFEADDQLEYSRKYSEYLAEHASVFARKIPVLPEVVRFDDMDASGLSLEKLPVGIEKRSINSAYLNIKNRYITPIIAAESATISNFAIEFMRAVDKLENVRVEVYDAERWFDQYDFATQPKDFAALNEKIFQDILNRNNGYKAAGMDLEYLEQFDEVLVIINGLEKTLQLLDEDGADKFKAMLFKGQALYKVRFLILESASALNAYTYDDWYKTHINGTEGLFVGDGFSDQYILKPNKMSNEYYAEIGNSFAYLMNKGKTTLVKLMTEE